MKERPRLQIEEVRIRAGGRAPPQRVEPEVPQQGDERHEAYACTDRRGTRQPALYAVVTRHDR